jgi:hypothetical protein
VKVLSVANHSKPVLRFSPISRDLDFLSCEPEANPALTRWVSFCRFELQLLPAAIEWPFGAFALDVSNAE